MMDVSEFKEYMRSGKPTGDNPEIFTMLNELNDRARRITGELNLGYHPMDDIRSIFSELICAELDPDFRLFPPFYTDCGINITVGKNVFINSGCCFQDQGGIVIGDDVLIGHMVVLATLNHELEPSKRQSMIPGPIVIKDKVWVGSHSTILAGVTIGEGAVVAAGAVVTKDVPPNTVVAGVPAKVVKTIVPEP